MDNQESGFNGMNSGEGISATMFDSIISDKKLQIIKAAIPYIPIGEQKFISIYVKLEELRNTMDIFKQPSVGEVGICSLPNEARNPSEMLNAIKTYCNDYERELLDLLTNFMSAFRIYNSYKGQNNNNNQSGPFDNINPMAAIKNMLSPEQQAMFETYSAAISGMKL